jgi:hypothetical protein
MPARPVARVRLPLPKDTANAVFFYSVFKKALYRQWEKTIKDSLSGCFGRTAARCKAYF